MAHSEIRRTKGEHRAIIIPMAGSRCRVSFTGPDGILHGVDVAIAVSQFRDDDVSPIDPGPGTEFTVAVYRNPTEHKIRLGQVAKWAEHTTKDGGPG